MNMRKNNQLVSLQEVNRSHSRAEMVERKVAEQQSSYKSKVWEYFGFYYIDGTITKDRQYVVCQTCFTKIHRTNKEYAKPHHPEL